MFFYMDSETIYFMIFIGLVIGIIIGCAIGYSVNSSRKVDAKTKLDISKKYNDENRTKTTQKNVPNKKDSNIVYKEKLVDDKEKLLSKREDELNKREELLNDREMAIAEGLDEIVSLKERVDEVINAQKEELFSYCSVSEESALKMKEVTLEVQKRLKEAIEKIQE